MFRLLTLLSLLVLVKNAYGQDAAFWKKNGQTFLEARQYQPALEAFEKAINLQPNNAETRMGIGICHFHLHQAAEAEANLTQAVQAKNSPPLAFIYLAKLHQAKLDFQKASSHYKAFLKRTAPDHAWAPAVRDELRRCETGLALRRQPPVAAVIPLADVNSSADEFAPLPSPSGQERFYFSASGRSSTGSDIFFTEVKAGDWSAPKPLNRFINSAAEETALGFDESSNVLYFFRGKTSESGQILVDTFRNDPLQGTLFFKVFNGPMRTDLGDAAPYFFNDSILLFASRREGGLGGQDLYVSVRQEGIWLPPKNLGPNINSAYDETSPFLSRDGRTLYFSSNDPERSMGGLDVLRSTFLDRSSQWATPVNLGSPVNSASDDAHFMLSYAGDRGFFDSDRITGEGGRDIFVALFEEPRIWQLSQSDPIAFCLVANATGPSEKAAQQSNNTTQLGFFDEISSFELPVMALPPPGGHPDEQAVNQFALLAQMLKKYPHLKLVLAIHAAAHDEPVAYFSFASQMATDLLRQEGVGTTAVTLLFAGSSYPFIANERRAEVFVYNPQLLPFGLYRPPLPKEAFQAQFFQKTMTSLAYRVDVEASEGLAKLFELYPHGQLEKSPETGKLVFSPGIYLTFSAAEEWRKNLVSDGFKNAQTLPYLRGFPLSKEQAAKYVKDFADLQNYLGE